MDLNPGEEMCPKCNGNGKYFESHTHELQHNHQLPAHNHGSSYAAESVCDRCGGAGKVDWVTRAMGESPGRFNMNNLRVMGSHTHSLTAPNEISFFSSEGSEVLKIAEDGFYIEGEKIEDKHKIYERFNKFITDAGY